MRYSKAVVTIFKAHFVSNKKGQTQQTIKHETSFSTFFQKSVSILTL